MVVNVMVVMVVSMCQICVKKAGSRGFHINQSMRATMGKTLDFEPGIETTAYCKYFVW